MAALRKIQCTGTRLEGFSVLLFGILAIEDLIPSKFLMVTLVVISRIEIELVIDDGVEPFAIYST